MYSTTPLSKFDPLFNLPDNKKSTEIKKKKTTKGFKLTSKREFIITSFTNTAEEKPRSPRYLIFGGD